MWKVGAIQCKDTEKKVLKALLKNEKLSGKNLAKNFGSTNSTVQSIKEKCINSFKKLNAANWNTKQENAAKSRFQISARKNYSEKHRKSVQSQDN